MVKVIENYVEKVKTEVIQNYVEKVKTEAKSTTTFLQVSGHSTSKTFYTSTL